ncbi:restriction endonuclease subunit S [Chryseobacterium rhizosphaerae]|uniref:Type I restriction modification DNA specificity domain-containing protein n=1 Tax=Chryseobacterium rhizosphaerae TaxID=395937 RepID=A0ABX9IMD6_9FLAO|nr:restriction endonuclease subunit S [Chryseobacterium rhizosphaerae]REC75458.1 hypothetical protein DRF57_10580 [Chryseobacterium rhizosphaerae]GEN66319.1 hypothetical protein CRH01_08870 [Chryseobacterium rhizosphaerae]
MKDKLPKGWEWKKLEEVGEVITGNTPPKSVVKYYLNGNIPFVKPPNLGNGIVIQTQEYVTEEALTKSRLIPKNSVMVCCIGSLGKVGIAGTDLITNQQINSINFNNKIVNYRFGYYYALTLEKYMLENANQAVVSIINKSTFSKYNFPLPPLSEQNQIVSVLDKTFEKLDQTIALVEGNIQKLKQLNESVLDEMFEGKHANWKTENLKKLTLKIGSGSTPTGGQNSYKESGISLIRSLNVHDWGFKEKNLAFIDEVQAKKLSNVEIENNDILLNITGASVARCCIVPENILPARVNQHVSILRIKKELLLPKFLHYSLISPFYKNQLLYNSSGGATREALSKNMLEKFEINYPTIIEQQRIVTYLDQTTEKSQKLTQYYQNKLEALKRLKNSVLDSAFKGELRRAKVIPITQPIIDPYFARTKSFNAKKKADKQAMVIALAIEAHEKNGKSLYRTKGEKTVEVIEKHIDLDFGRVAKKMAAGPAAFEHLVKVVEPLAKEKKWFSVQEVKGDNYDGHKYIKAENFNAFMMRCVLDLRPKLQEIRRVIDLFANMKTTHEAEVVATIYSGWNNLIIRKTQIDDEAIVTEARENWHDSKLKIERQEFFNAIEWLKNNNLIPQGNGREVI